MPMNESDIIRLIKESLPDAYIELKDLRGDGDSFQAYVESRSFIGKTLIQQHQMIFDALQGRVGGVIRTFSLTTAVPPKA